MDPRYWRDRWRAAEISFDQKTPNALLVQHADHALGTASRIVVPLCGKTVDLTYLADRGASVVGIELVEEAARAFFDEQELTAMRTVDGPRVRWESGPIEIVSGDFFEISAGEIGTFEAAYDRAALVALPAAMRARYAAHLRSLLEPGGRMLVITFEHDGPTTTPPFSVSEDEVHALYPGARIERLEVRPAMISSVLSRGASFVRECVYSLIFPE
jgi:thiopurine S-methyltransferase